MDSELRYRTTINCMSDPLHVVDEGLRIVLFNEALRRLNEELELPTDIAGKSIFEAFPFLPDSVRQEYQRVLKTGRPLTTEDHICVNGRELITETRKSPIMPHGKAAGVLTIIKDITEQVSARKSLEWQSAVNAALADLANELLGESVDSESMANLVLNCAVRLTQSSRACICSQKSGTDKIIQVASQGDNPQLLQDLLGGTRRKYSDGPDGNRMQTGWFENSPGEGIAEKAWEKAAVVQRYLVAPARVGDDIPDYIVLADAESPYTEQSLSAVNRIATLYALALQRQKAQQQLVEYQRRLEGLVSERTAELTEANKRLQIEIAERKKADESLKTSEEKYRTLVESAGESIATIDADGVFLFVNTTGAKRLGTESDKVVGKKMWELFPKQVADRQAASVREVIATGQSKNVLVPTVVKGRQRWYSTTIEPLRNSTGRITSAMVIARDIDDLKRAQDQLNKHHKDVSRTEHLASLGTLSATISHELTQPLTVVNLCLENAMVELENTEGCERARSDLQDGLKAVKDITDAINRFRSFAGKSSEKGFGEVYLEPLAERVLKLLDEQAWKAGIQLDIRMPEDLRPVYANEKDMQQMIYLLAENAIQAVDGKKGKHSLRVEAENRIDHVVLRFVDDCIGIKKEHIGRILEPFFTTKEAGRGTGLGLCVVERIVERAGGKIEIESKYGKGSTFTVTLPVTKQISRRQRDGV